MHGSIVRVSSGPRTDIDLESTVTRLNLRSTKLSTRRDAPPRIPTMADRSR
jgi:hypothetical protein